MTSILTRGIWKCEQAIYNNLTLLIMSIISTHVHVHVKRSVLSESSRFYITSVTWCDIMGHMIWLMYYMCDCTWHHIYTPMKHIIAAWHLSHRAIQPGSSAIKLVNLVSRQSHLFSCQVGRYHSSLCCFPWNFHVCANSICGKVVCWIWNLFYYGHYEVHNGNKSMTF